MSSQPSLWDRPVGRPTKTVNVPTSSVEAWRALPEREKNRRTSYVVELVRSHPGLTSKELACVGNDSRTTDYVLWVRRGLSDALAKGLVEHAGKRICTVAGTMAICWKVRSR